MNAVPATGLTVLLVDDDERLRDLLTVVLGQAGYRVVSADRAEAALEAVAAGVPDVVVLDIGLGDDDGRVVLSSIREGSDVPVVMISGHGDVADRILGLRLGADDYLPKPFSPVELEARIEAVLRRHQGEGPATGELSVPVVGLSSGPEDAAPDALVVDEATREVVACGRRVELTAREFDLLAFLVRSPRQVFTRSQMLESVWDSRSEWQDEATVTEHIRRVRRKVERDPDHPRWVTTVRGVGYRFEP